MSGTSRGQTIAIRLSLEGANEIRDALERLGPEGQRALERIERATADSGQEARALAGAWDGVGRSLSAASAATVALQAAAAGLVGGGIVGGLAAIARAGDEATQTMQRLTSATSGNIQAAAGALQSLYRIALETGTPVAELAGGFSRFAIAAREVGATQRQIESLVETLTKAAALNGGSAQEAAAGAQQLGQALASGRLQGDELRSILENLPGLAERLARELGVSVGALREMGSQGQLTAENVLPALLRAGEDIRKEFSELGPTMGRSFGQLQVALSRILGDLDRAIGLSRTLARAAGSDGGIASSINNARISLGLGTPEETAQRDIVSQRSAVIDARRAQERRQAELDRALQRAGGDTTDPAVEERARRVEAAKAEAARQEAELRDREAKLEGIRGEARRTTEDNDRSAAQRGAENRRVQSEAAIAELTESLDRRVKIENEYKARKEVIARALADAAIDEARARTLQAQADKERADALKALEEAAKRATIAQKDEAASRNPETGQSYSVESLLGKIRDKEDEEAAAEAERAARASGRILEEQAKAAQKTTDDIVSYFGNAFALAFNDTAGGFSSLMQSFRRSAISTFARIAAEAVIRPIISPIVSAAGSGFGSGGIGGLLNTGGAFFAAEGAAGSAGGLFSGGLGLSGTLAGAGSAVNGLGVSSGLFGNGISPAAQGPTPSGAPLGSLSQSGLFGTQTFTQFASGVGLGFGAGSFVGGMIADARGTVGPGSTIGAGAGALIGTAVGGPIGGLIGGVIGGAAGGFIGPTRKGMEARAGGDVFYGVEGGRLVITGSRGKRFDDESARAQVQAQIDSVNAALTPRGLTLDDLSGRVGFGRASSSPRALDQAAILRALRSDRASETTAFATLADRGADLNKALEASDFIRQILEPLEKLAKPADQFAEAMKEVTDRFGDATKRAQDLGLETDKLNAARDREIAKLTLTREAASLRTVATQQGTLVGFLNSLAGESLSPQDRLTAAQDSFGAALNDARAAGLGRADLTGLVAAGRNLVDAGRSFYASGPGAADLQSFVRRSVENLGAQFNLPAFGGSLDTAVESLNGLTDEVQLLRDEVSRLRDELRSARLLRAA